MVDRWVSHIIRKLYANSCHGQVLYSGKCESCLTPSRAKSGATQPAAARQHTLNGIVNKLPNGSESRHIFKSIAHFICKDLQPYSVVENTGFWKMVCTLEQKEVFLNKVKSCWLSSWVLRQSSHHIAEDRSLSSHILQTSSMHENHMRENVAELLCNVRIKCNITEKFHVKHCEPSLNLASQRALPYISQLLQDSLDEYDTTGLFHRSTKELQSKNKSCWSSLTTDW